MGPSHEQSRPRPAPPRPATDRVRTTKLQVAPEVGGPAGPRDPAGGARSAAQDVQSAMAVQWMTAVIDFPAATYGPACAFWQAVTGFTLSVPGSGAGELGALVPQRGNTYLRVQRVDRDNPGCRLVLYVDDLDEVERHAEKVGAAIARPRSGFIVMSSPAGLPLCVAAAGGERQPERPQPQFWPSGHRSVVDQLCLDIPSVAFGAEGFFWEAITGWERRPGSRPEFEYLVRPPAMPLRLLLQRLEDDEHGPGRAHLDLACDDVPAERFRHESLGAVFVAEPSWTTLRDPAGLAYCITRRDPFTGTLRTP